MQALLMNIIQVFHECNPNFLLHGTNTAAKFDIDQHVQKLELGKKQQIFRSKKELSPTQTEFVPKN